MLLKHLIALATASLFTPAFAVPNALANANRPCGMKLTACPRNQFCIPQDGKCSDLTHCQGVCIPGQAYPQCEWRGLLAPRCDKSATCKDDPRIPNNCGLKCGGKGICIPKSAPSCAGPKGTPCPMGLQCYDAPGDSCHPKDGGENCVGVCL